MGDVVEIRGFRARWNAFEASPELTSAGRRSLVRVLATASDVLSSSPVDVKKNRPSTPNANPAETLAAAVDARRSKVSAWALEAREHVLRSAADAAAFDSAAAAAAAAAAFTAFASASGAPRTLFDERSFSSSALRRGGGVAHRAAEDLAGARSAHFLGRVVSATTIASGAAAEDAGDDASEEEASSSDGAGLRSGARPRKRGGGGEGFLSSSPGSSSPPRVLSPPETSPGSPPVLPRFRRPRLWLSQGPGARVEATLPAMPAAEAVRAARALEGEVVELRHFRVWRRFSSGRHCLVAPDVVEPGAPAGEGPVRHLGPGQGPAAEPAAANPTWRLVSRDDPLAAEIASRCPSSRVVARAASAREAFEARTNRDADFVRFPASVAWARLPDPPGTRFKPSADARRDVLRARRRAASRERRGRSSSRTRAVMITPEELAARMLALGCLACGRELDPDPDGDGIARQCACHDGSRNLVGRIWRPLEIGLANPTGTVPVPVPGGFEEETEAPGGGGEGDDRRGDASGGGRRRPAAAATPARVRDSALVAKILMGVDPAEAARCAARRRRRGGIDDAPRAGVLIDDDDARGPGEGRRESSGAGAGDDEGRPFFPLPDASARADPSTPTRPLLDARDDAPEEDAPDDALAVAARGLNALCAGAEANMPFEWVARTRAVDANGVAWTGGGAALEIVGFDVEIGRRDESAS